MNTGEQLIQVVKQRYGAIAKGQVSGCCGPQTSGCAAPESAVSLGIGYSAEQLAEAQDSNLGLGCGAPLGFLALQPGETVLDLGSGAGLDAFLAAKQVGESGKVIGVDMTPEMLERARSIAAKRGLGNVEFREGRLEALPVESQSVDAITSNCVINLVPDKGAAFRETARVLKPSGRLVISDIVLDAPIPEAVEKDLYSYVGCVSGAMLKDAYFGLLRDAGLDQIELLRDVDYLEVLESSAPEEVREFLARTGVKREDVAGRVRSVTFRATRTPAVTA